MKTACSVIVLSIYLLLPMDMNAADAGFVVAWGSNSGGEITGKPSNDNKPGQDIAGLL